MSQAAQCDRCKRFVSNPKPTDWLDCVPHDYRPFKPEGWISLSHNDFAMNQTLNLMLCASCREDFKKFMESNHGEPQTWTASPPLKVGDQVQDVDGVDGVVKPVAAESKICEQCGKTIEERSCFVMQEGKFWHNECSHAMPLPF